MTDLQGVKGWLDILTAANESKAKAEEAIAVARQHIEDALGDDDTGTIDGEPVVRWTTVTSRRFDATKAKELLPDDLREACMTEGTSRRFVLVKP